MAARAEHARNPTLALPHALVRAILSRLPADQRARVACVCVSWRTAVADPQLWARLDLTAESGVTCRVDGAALRAAAARARGGLVALHAPRRIEWLAALRDVVADNAATLRELRLCPSPTNRSASLDELLALLAAAPALQVLEADVHCSAEAARRLLRNEPPLGPLRLRRLVTHFRDSVVRAGALAADLAAHPSLSELGIFDTPDDFSAMSPGDMVAVVDAALRLRLTSLEVATPLLPATAAPAVMQLLSSAALTRLRVSNSGGNADVPLLDAPAAALLSAALHANSTLRSLRLCNFGLWDDVAVATAVLGALTGHASIRSLQFSHNRLHNAAAGPAVGEALGTLVAADAPALTEIDVSYCLLGDAGLRPLVDALTRNTHLRSLDIERNTLSTAFNSQRLLPAVHANRSLRELFMDDDGSKAYATARAAVQLVAAREAARVAEAAAAALVAAAAAAAGGA